MRDLARAVAQACVAWITYDLAVVSQMRFVMVCDELVGTRNVSHNRVMLGASPYVCARICRCVRRCVRMRVFVTA